LIQYAQELPKRYLATFQLGCRSDSDDTELPVTAVDAPPPVRVAIEAVIPSFVGTIQQRPPAFSAIKVQGRRAYDLARDGKQIELDARPITVYAIDVVSYEYPELVLDIRCGGGTYIRSIGRDLAEQLGTAAVMSALVRTEIGPFTIEDAIDPQQLSSATVKQQLRSAREAVAHLPSIVLDAEQLQMLSNGIMLPAPSGPQCAVSVAFDQSGRLISVLVPHNADRLRPMINFAPLLAADNEVRHD
jgi:tRNA pseudouridine55 synthase